MAAAARKSPGQRIAGSIAFLVVFGLILVFLFGTPTDEYEKTKACTAEMTVQTVRRHYLIPAGAVDIPTKRTSCPRRAASFNILP